MRGAASVSACLVLLCAGGLRLAPALGARPCRRRSGRSRSWSTCGRASSTASPTGPTRPTSCRPRSTPCASRRPTCGPRPLAAAALARNDLADTKKLLAPLEVKPGPDQPPETDAVKAERERLTEQATISESRVKQCEVIDRPRRPAARAHDQAARRRWCCRPCCTATPRRCRATVWRRLVAADSRGAADARRRPSRSGAANGLQGLALGRPGPRRRSRSGRPLTIGLWWVGRMLRRRFGRGDAVEPGQRDRTIAAAIDGLGLVLVPILAVWLIGQLLAGEPAAAADRRPAARIRSSA